MAYLDTWSDYDDFKSFVASLKLRHFAASELLGSVGNIRDGVTNEGPPPEVWGNIVPTLLILDELRAQMGAPIKINSCYRFPAYNAVVPGSSKKSMHIAFRAIDFQVKTSTPGKSLKEATNLLKAWREDPDKWFETPIEISSHQVLENKSLEIPVETKTENGKHYFRFSGGIGLYNTFTHFDTRGRNANWDVRRKSRSRSKIVFDFDAEIEFGE